MAGVGCRARWQAGWVGRDSVRSRRWEADAIGVPRGRATHNGPETAAGQPTSRSCRGLLHRTRRPATCETHAVRRANARRVRSPIEQVLTVSGHPPNLDIEPSSQRPVAEDGSFRRPPSRPRAHGPSRSTPVDQHPSPGIPFNRSTRPLEPEPVSPKLFDSTNVNRMANRSSATRFPRPRPPARVLDAACGAPPNS